MALHKVLLVSMALHKALLVSMVLHKALLVSKLECESVRVLWRHYTLSPPLINGHQASI